MSQIAVKLGLVARSQSFVDFCRIHALMHTQPALA